MLQDIIEFGIDASPKLEADPLEPDSEVGAVRGCDAV